MKLFRIVWLGIALAAMPATGQQGTAAQNDWPAGRSGHQRADSAVIVFLVRHAETTPDGSRDPALSTTGIQRARRLAETLADAGVSAVLTTDYRRTRSTAAPVADRLGVEPDLYDPGSLQDLARQLRTGGDRRVLVVGHSNTTPALVAALGGAPGPPITESEHDRLYVMVLGPDSTQTVVLRY